MEDNEKTLIVEDSEDRIRWFRSKIPSADIATTSQEAIMLLEKNNYYRCFLDHDLNGEVFVKSGKGTGYEVAQYIVDNNIDIHDIIVHSMNPVGARNICNVLPHARRIPFGTFDLM